MKLNRLHSITLTSLLALLLFTGCQDETDALPSEGRRTITLDLGIAMTRAAEGESDNTRPDNLELWVFDGNTAGANRIFYENITDGLTFSIADLQGTLIQTIQRVFDVENEINTLHFYIVMNTNGLNLTETSTPQDIETATFSHGSWAGDNKVPIYGYNTLDVSQHRSQYSLPIETERAVGKLELFFTKESESSKLTINSVSITHDPNKGYLKKPENYTLIYSEKERDLFTDGQEIFAVLTQEEEATVGNFSEYENNSAKMQRLFSTYLLENPTGGTWNNTTNPDFSYPYEEETSTAIEDETTRYKMTVNYTLGSQTKKQIIYLPAIERNVRNKIFARVKDEEAKLELTYEVNPWEREDITVNYEDNLSYRQGQWITEDEEGNPILEIRENQTVHFLDTRSTAILEFAIPTPLLTVWRAELRGADRNYFTFVTIDENGDEVPVDGNLSGLASQNGQPIDPLQIRIKCTEPDSEDTHSVTLHVFASIGGQDYELNLTDPDKTDQINRFTILQSR